MYCPLLVIDIPSESTGTGNFTQFVSVVQYDSLFAPVFLPMISIHPEALDATPDTDPMSIAPFGFIAMFALQDVLFQLMSKDVERVF